MRGCSPRTGPTSRSVADPNTGEWKHFGLSGQAIDLDQAYEQIVRDSWIALADDTIRHRGASPLGYIELYRADAVTIRSRSDFGLASRVTHVELDTSEHLDWFGRRTALVLAESEQLPLAERPLRSPLLGDVVALG